MFLHKPAHIVTILQKVLAGATGCFAKTTELSQATPQLKRGRLQAADGLSAALAELEIH
jgi:hypothetical protein